MLGTQKRGPAQQDLRETTMVKLQQDVYLYPMPRGVPTPVH